MPLTPHASRARWAYGGLLGALFVYLFLARVFDSHHSFLLLRDQMRDWRIAMGSFGSLPLTGTQSTAGGASLGPVYYWVLWLSRVVFGPWVDNLPHAGAWGIALLQSTADLFLLHAVRSRTGSTWIGVAVVLLAATTAHDLAISATIWNPAVSVAFVKFALAIRLTCDARRSLWWTVAGTACSWLAVQAHSAAVFITAPLVASWVFDDLRRARYRRAAEQVRTIAEVLVLLQLPFLVHLLTTTAEAVPTRALAGAAAGSYRLADSTRAMLYFLASILSAPWRAAWWPTLLVLAAGVATFRWRRSVPVLACTAGPLMVTAAGFGLWQGNYDEYWYLPLAPCAALTAVLALTAWRPQVTGVALSVALLLIQPGRIQASLHWYRMPEYQAIVDGARAILRQTHELRRLETTFRMPPFSHVAFPYETMGGRFRDDAGFDAIIAKDGSVQFRPVH